jgi:glycosyltransferase involved in cell wall biosynthesis
VDKPSLPGSAWPVMVLAHNEERHIAACLDSLFEGEPGRDLQVYVMANGCSDRTEAIVQDYASRNPSVHLVSIKMPDKCNAWNVFVHETARVTAPDLPVYFFMDGDARIVPGALSRLADSLEMSPRAHAASAPPASGRNVDRDRRDLIDERVLVANLYALRGSFVKRLQQTGARLPLGLEGDDGLLGALIKWDLQPDKQEFDDSRIVPCPSSGFVFESVSPLDPTQWRGYWKRAVRYGRRFYEFQLLGPLLKKRGLSGLPVHVKEVYTGAERLSLRWKGFYTLTNWIALRAMRRAAR